MCLCCERAEPADANKAHFSLGWPVHELYRYSTGLLMVHLDDPNEPRHREGLARGWTKADRAPDETHSPAISTSPGRTGVTGTRVR